MFRGLKNLSFLFIFFILFSQSSASELLKVDEKTQMVDVTPFSEVFIDNQNHFSYEDVFQETFRDNFKPSNDTSVVSSGAKDALWLRFNIVNASNSTFFGKLEIPIIWLNKTEVYLRTQSKEGNGEFDTLNLSNLEEINARSFFVPLEMKPLQSSALYIKAQSVNKMAFAPKIYSEQKAEERTIYIAMLNGALIGIVLVLFLYNLRNYMTLKDENYLYYLYYLVGLLFLVGTYYGYNLQLLWDSSYKFNENIYYPIVAFNFLTALLLSRNFLKVDKQSAKTDKYLLIFVAFSVLLGIFGIVGSSDIAAYTTFIFTLINFIFLASISAISMKNKISGSGYILLAWLFLSVGNLVLIGMLLGFIEYKDFIYDVYAVLIVLNILMISFAMVERIRDEESQFESEVQKEHEVASKLNISKKELRELNEKLQRKLARQERELAEKNKECEKFSTKDEITKLYNKTKLEEILTNELHRAKRYNYWFSIIITNIDGMKGINDTHGYEVGNSVMKEMGELFMRHIRYLDTVGRWSDNEYLIICPQTKANEAFTAAEHLQSFVERNKFFFIGKATASFGVTDSQPDDTLQEIMKRGYEALAKAKENGRNRVEAL
ncbi:MAG: diguanylate cyclase [Sulfurimonas sp.]|uniref:sensor domain-containing diguanylate cyclase n=1 Tax=Sulfurimonas sp. TaxID=2022749 RepID=UPI0028CD5716|nr:diguanylate cyclase [Sulfurimonas sp.]MDT8337930.1 diguanylate cyclase [Sulfurimonas sp.]